MSSLKQGIKISCNKVSRKLINGLKIHQTVLKYCYMLNTMSLRIIFALLKKWRLGSLTAILDS